MFTDTHCHLDFYSYDADRPEVILRARQAGLAFIVNPGVDLPSAGAVLKLTEDYPGYIYAAVGITPITAPTANRTTSRVWKSWLPRLASSPLVKLVLITTGITARQSSSAALSSGSWNWPPAWRCRSSFTTGMPRRTWSQSCATGKARCLPRARSNYSPG
jgi:Mg-dependent DNase